MFFIQSFKSAELREKTREIGIVERSVKGNRGHIYDRNGEMLAETIHKYTFWVNTQEDIKKEEIIKLFSTEFRQPLSHYKHLLNQDKSYIKLTNGLLRTQCIRILSRIKDIPGLHYDMSINRFYPYNSLTSHVIGYVDMDHKGQLGIEQQFDSALNGKVSKLIYNRAANGRINKSFTDKQPEIKNGLDLQLTLDVEIQTILVDGLKRGLKKSHATSANGIILNPFTGDILAMASVPDYNPNNYQTHDITSFSNRTISDSYEPGSTFKLIAMAAIIESGLYKINDLIYCEEGEYQLIPSKLIHDHEPYGNLSLAEIFIYSSNIGITKVVDQLGSEHIYDYARKFGFGVKTGIPLPNENSGVLRPYIDWSRLSAPSVSMGQEISVNSLQLALAYSAVANGGYLPSPRILLNISGDNYEKQDFSPRPVRQVMSNKTSQILLKMMEAVVNEGTATNAYIPGFRIGGKTGTAEKFIDGGYSETDFISSFAAVFPTDDPKYVCVISVDSPVYGYHWGNETAAPIVKDIFERLITNDDMNPIKPQLAHRHANSIILPNEQYILTAASFISKEQNNVPNFIGKTLKQSIQEAKMAGLTVEPVGLSGKVVWQSEPPGKRINEKILCKIKLESM